MRAIVDSDHGIDAQAQQGQQQDQKRLLASQEWYDAKRRNKGLTEEVEKLRHALQMVRQVVSSTSCRAVQHLRA